MSAWGAVFLLGSALLAAVAWGHDLRVDVRQRGAELVARVYFSTGTVSEGADVIVRLGDREVARGTTDGKGVFVQPIDAPGLYRIEVREPALHRAYARIEVDAGSLAADRAGASPEAPRERSGIPGSRAAQGMAAIALLAGLLHAFQRRSRRP